MNFSMIPVELHSPEAFNTGQCMSKRAWTRREKQKIIMGLGNVNCKENLMEVGLLI